MVSHPIPAGEAVPPRFSIFAFAAALLALAGCADPNVGKALSARQSLVGMPKERLLACAGVPDKSAAIDNVEYFTYASRAGRASGSGVSVGLGGFSGNFGGGIGVPLSSPSVSTCEATFTLRNNRVETLNYGGNGDDGAPLGQCWHIVENCTPQG